MWPTKYNLQNVITIQHFMRLLIEHKQTSNKRWQKHPLKLFSAYSLDRKRSRKRDFMLLVYLQKADWSCALSRKEWRHKAKRARLSKQGSSSKQPPSSWQHLVKAYTLSKSPSKLKNMRKREVFHFKLDRHSLSRILRSIKNSKPFVMKICLSTFVVQI